MILYYQKVLLLKYFLLIVMLITINIIIFRNYVQILVNIYWWCNELSLSSVSVCSVVSFLFSFNLLLSKLISMLCIDRIVFSIITDNYSWKSVPSSEGLEPINIKTLVHYSWVNNILGVLSMSEL